MPLYLSVTHILLKAIAKPNASCLRNMAPRTCIFSAINEIAFPIQRPETRLRKNAALYSMKIATGLYSPFGLNLHPPPFKYPVFNDFAQTGSTVAICIS